MRTRNGILTLLITVAVTVQGNTEKVIFSGPSIEGTEQSIEDLHSLYLSTVSEAQPKLRTKLPVAFPTRENPNGIDSWILISEAKQHQRYELRQPTTFYLEIFDASQVTADLALNQSLFEYSRQYQVPHDGALANQAIGGTLKGHARLFLRIQAAADFFTTDRRLMESPPSVEVDLILDPYLFGVFPQSLGATAAYIITLAIFGFVVSDLIWRYISDRIKPVKDRKD